VLSDESPDPEFWCPLGEEHAPIQFELVPGMTVSEHGTLSRLAAGDWLSDLQIARLEHLELVERVFGQALLTRLGRAVLHMDGSAGS
jgi:hypothetical protein